MKRVIICLLAFLIIFASVTAASASTADPPYSVPEQDEPAATGVTADLSPAAVTSVPRIEINTENGNGTQLLKADGYVNAQISITDANGSVLSDAIQLKVRGNSTAIDSIAKKAFTFKFEKKKDVLGMGKGKKWALLANCFDPTLLRNYLVFRLADELGLPYVSEQRFVELWLDGSYRGCYTVYEPVQEGKDRVDIDVEGSDGKKDFLLEYEASRTEDDVTYITVSGLRFAIKEPDPPDAAQTLYINDTMEDILNTVRHGTEAQIREKLDIDSFAKFYLLNEYAKTADFGLSSVFFFYKDGRLYAGPPWDYDLSLGNLNAELNSTTAKEAAKSDGIMQSSKNIYRYLYPKPWFTDEVKRVYAKYYDLFDSVAADDGTLDSLRATYQAVIDRNFGVWRVGRHWLNYQKPPFATYEENYAFLKSWCAERHAWLTNCYGLTPYTFLIGDADGSGEVEITDATLIQRVLAMMTADSDGMIATRAALSGDELDITDATALQRFLANIYTPHHINEEKTVMVF